MNQIIMIVGITITSTSTSTTAILVVACVVVVILMSILPNVGSFLLFVLRVACISGRGGTAKRRLYVSCDVIGRIPAVKDVGSSNCSCSCSCVIILLCNSCRCCRCRCRCLRQDQDEEEEAKEETFSSFYVFHHSNY